jgi:hypothetical protein
MTDLAHVIEAAWWNANFIWHHLNPPYDISWDYYDKELYVTPHVQIVIYPWTRA